MLENALCWRMLYDEWTNGRSGSTPVNAVWSPPSVMLLKLPCAVVHLVLCKKTEKANGKG